MRCGIPNASSHLVLYGGFARGRRKRGSQQEIEQADALLTLMRHGWGQENPAFRQIFTSLFIPGRHRRADAVVQRPAAHHHLAGERGAHPRRRIGRHRRHAICCRRCRCRPWCCIAAATRCVPFEEGRRLAAGIPGARFVALEGHNHLVLESDPGWGRFLDEIREFLKT